ncbi:MAG TPA: hypothetical protein VMU27_00895 [Candidatus Paceibacterota bacterium]|nr:hypothetical protein [Candidatus Paceibacterota bacterium]
MRATLAIVGFIAAIATPFWLPLICIILLSVRYHAWEAILIGAFIDLSWMPHDASFASLPLFTIASMIIVWGFEPLRAQFLVVE